MLNFTVGPVMTWDELLHIGSQQVPYFRTSEFSEIMKENERMMLEYANAPKGSRSVFLTGSGTMGMEASIVNFLDAKDNVLVINGGSFGHRFLELCDLHGISQDAISLERGHQIMKKDLERFDGKNYSALLINMHETSTGVLYDMDLIAQYCKKNDIFLVVDAISAFLADEVDMDRWGIDVLITSSQKALACAPGISNLVLSPKALERLESITCPNMYMDIKDALRNGDRGQTPFTPAVLTLLQINRRLQMVKARGGVSAEIMQVRKLASLFREKIKELPLELVSESPSNAVTALHPTNGMSAKAICDRMKDEYNIWICPNGGDMADYMFRVGHIGNITEDHIATLVDALTAVMEKA